MRLCAGDGRGSLAEQDPMCAHSGGQHGGLLSHTNRPHPNTHGVECGLHPWQIPQGIRVWLFGRNLTLSVIDCKTISVLVQALPSVTPQRRTSVERSRSKSISGKLEVICSGEKKAWGAN